MNSTRTPEPQGQLLEIDGELTYVIRDVDRLPPFLMTIVGESDHWLFVSSTGALTAGRSHAERALFPYETEDRIHRAAGRTGSFTLLRCVRPDGEVVLWEPFTGRRAEGGRRSLCKTPSSDRLRFEEVHEGLGLTFTYEWGLSDEYGFVRRASLTARAGGPAVAVAVVDGLRCLLPAGIGTRLQESASVLGNAYTHSEIVAPIGLGIYSLTALIVDKAEPAEALRANVAWSIGLPSPVQLLSTDQLAAFRAGEPLRDEPLSTGRRGDYLVAASLQLAPGQTATWYVVADADRSQFQVAQLAETLTRGGVSGERLESTMADNRRRLRAHIAAADGLQAGADQAITARHIANTMFNCMRGGVLVQNAIPCADLTAFVRSRNGEVGSAHQSFFEALPTTIDRQSLLDSAAERGDPSLYRLCSEYLPITFSRRHGDPSRPWNRFSINVRHPDGSRRLDYEGNWRDVFQNWEALCLSFPDFIEAAIAIFVNASTVDGFNPYRLTRAGIDWEVPEPDDPFANIGYWGDHQIIYLLKLLEASVAHHPEKLRAALDQPHFTYADVPYRLKAYEALVHDPHNTIDYDDERARIVEARTERLGGDGKLLHDAGGDIVYVTLAEKLLVPLLAKLSNLVADGGIWMNTQRPEWNDANNALVGYGVSMVTHAYLLRHVTFLEPLFAERAGDDLALSTEVASWLERVSAILGEHHETLAQPVISDTDRRRLLDALGTAFGDYRAAVYRDGFSGRVSCPAEAVSELLATARAYLEHGLRAARRADGLFHAYNLLDVSEPDQAKVDHLYEMLEGQVAVLNTDLLDAGGVCELVDALFASRMYRADQHTFLLYPDRRLPRFLERNVVPAERVAASRLLSRIAKDDGQALIGRDASGRFRFDSDFRNAKDLAAALDRLGGEPAWRELVDSGRQVALDVWEDVFNHRAFTGRSGTMYGYEGLGSIYWHMVSKLILAVQERFFDALDASADSDVLRALAERYYRTREGLGFNKTVAEYGVFPTDPYSHTPPDGQARQPGMTGQVKEDVIARRGELGVRIRSGCVSFEPALLRRRELLTAAASFRYVDAGAVEREIPLEPGRLAFTLCQVPVIYTLTDDPPSIRLSMTDGSQTDIVGRTLPSSLSARIFGRDRTIERLEVGLSADELLLS